MGRYMEIQLDSSGLGPWPGREDFNTEFIRMLASAQHGGATIAECLSAAGSIDVTDSSWYRAWTGLADVNSARASQAIRSGYLATARSNWLRAMNYYQAAASPLEPSMEREQSIRCMRQCATQYLRYRSQSAELVHVPWLADHSLQGYFLPAAGKARAPTVICIGEPGCRKEELLYKAAPHAEQRGLSMLAVDLHGPGVGAEFETLIAASRLETAVGQLMDYVVERPDVDDQRIAIYADACSSSFVARSIARDGRFAAAVCDGGIWDLHEQAFLNRRSGSTHGQTAFSPSSKRISQYICCPVLVTVGERGWLEPETVTELFDQIRDDGPARILKIFTSEETASAQAHVDNPTLANEYIFDWVASRLSEVPAEDQPLQPT